MAEADTFVDGEGNTWQFYENEEGGPGSVQFRATPDGLVVGAMDDVGAYGTADVLVPWPDVESWLAAPERHPDAGTWQDVDAYVVSAVPRDDDNHDLWSVQVQRRPGFAGERWAVCWMGRVLNRDGDWEWDPIPSSRTDGHLDRTRFDRDDALARARAAAATLEVNGVTPAMRAEIRRG